MNVVACEHIWKILSPRAKKALLELELEGEDNNEHR